MTREAALLVIWIGFMILMVVALAGVLLWAIRSRQFGNQNRARYLPLMSGIPGGNVKGLFDRDVQDIQDKTKSLGKSELQ